MILYLSIYSIIISIIIAIYNWRINKNALFLSGTFIVFSSYSLAHYFSTESNNPFWVAIFYGNLSPLWYLPGPLIYLYTRNTILDKVTLRQWDYLHLLPTFIQFINMSPYIFSSFDTKLGVAELIISDLNNIKFVGGGFLYSPTIAISSRPILVIIYCAISSSLLYHYNPRKLLVEQNRNVLIWIIVLITTIFLVVTSYFVLTLMLFGSPVSRIAIESKPAHLVSGIAFFLLPTTLILFFPQILYGMPIAPTNKTKKTRPKSTDEDPLLETATYITNFIKIEKLYLHPDFDIAEISNTLGIPKHHIVYCFSVILRTRFTTYRSQLRVEHAKKLLKSGITETLSIDGIGAQSGFPSRSSFYASFKAETGMTPSQYLEKIA
jgi:AraC-like DNA-binding protein